jgi:hypothetical protein
MGRFKMVAFSDPVAEYAGEFDEWYLEHLHEVVDVPGFTAAQQFKLHDVVMGEMKNRFMAIYDLETDDPKACFDALVGRHYVMGRSLDQASVTLAFFEERSPLVTAPG